MILLISRSVVSFLFTAGRLELLSFTSNTTPNPGLPGSQWNKFHRVPTLVKKIVIEKGRSTVIPNRAMTNSFSHDPSNESKQQRVKESYKSNDVKGLAMYFKEKHLVSECSRDHKV